MSYLTCARDSPHLCHVLPYLRQRFTTPMSCPTLPVPEIHHTYVMSFLTCARDSPHLQYVMCYLTCATPMSCPSLPVPEIHHTYVMSYLTCARDSPHLCHRCGESLAQVR